MPNVYKVILGLQTLIIGLLMTACHKETIDDPSTFTSYSSKTVSSDGQIILGRRFEDPYKYENMVNAFNQLRAEGIVFPFQTLPVSGYYVKVLVTNDSIENCLDSISTIEWYDFPLDCELPEGGMYYYDSTLSDTIKWKYGVVPTDFTFSSDLTYQLLYSVLIPDEIRPTPTQQPFFDMIENRSLLLCGMLYDRNNTETSESDADQDTSQLRSGGWYPSATIKAWDDIVHNYVYLQGVKVVAKCGTSTKNYAITDAQGHCTMNKVKANKKITYIVRWERNYWKIRNSSKKDLIYTGPSVRNHSWTWEIGTDNKYNVNVATIHRAALKAFYGYFCGLQRPKAWGKLYIKYIDSYNEDENGHTRCTWNLFGLFSNITIYGKDMTFHSYHSTDKLMGVVFHEFGHQSMLKFKGGSAFYYTHNQFIRESWASCVAWAITNHYYQNDLNIPTYHYYLDRQDWTKTYMSNDSVYYPYTPIFIDLIDDINQNEYSSSYCTDNIKDYTVSEIQNLILGSSYELSSLKNTLHNHLLHGATSALVDELCNNYSNCSF